MKNYKEIEKLFILFEGLQHILFLYFVVVLRKKKKATIVELCFWMSCVLLKKRQE